MKNVFQSINPYTLGVIAEYEVMNNEKIEKRLAHAGTAFNNWRKTSFKQRSDLMMHLADLLITKRTELADIITMEMGKITKEAVAEIEKCASACRYFAEHAESFLKDKIMPSDAAESYVRYDPIGAILAIMPWNFPFWQVFRFAAPNIMAGNVGLLKHAPNTCGAAIAIENIFLEAGFPEGIFQSLIIQTEDVPSIIDHPLIQGVTLTGSELAGSKVAQQAGKAIKKTVLELGGSDAFIVLPDADIQKAVQVAVISRMQNAGQSCIAAKRFIVVSSIHDEFVDLFHDEIKKIKQGDPKIAETTMGPMAKIDLAEKLDVQIKNSVDKGAHPLIYNERNHYNVKPSLLVNVWEGMPAFDEETFGPMAAVIKAADEKEAINITNRSRYGLGASLWSQDIEKAKRLAADINSGGVFINTLVKSDPRLPFGGIKKSGHGRELSSFGIKEFMNMKTICIGE